MLLNEDQTALQDVARRFAAERIAPHAAQWDEDGKVPDGFIKELGELGFMGMTIAEEWGGSGLDDVACAIVLEELSAGSGSVGIMVSGHVSVGGPALNQFGTDDQKERFLRPLAQGDALSAFILTEPEGGSDVAEMRTTAERRNDGYVLNGTKQFITSGQSGDIALIFARTDPSAPRGKGISAFLVETDTPGYVVERVENKMGLRASDTCQIRLENMVVPFENRLGEEGEGYRIALSNLEGGRIGIAAQACGIARAAVDAAIDYAKERQSFGKPIMEHQAVGFRLADCATKLEAARQLYLHAAQLRDAGLPCLKEASMAKLFATEMAEQICSDAIQTFGGMGYMEDMPVARLARDARGAKIYEGTNDIQRLVIARALTAAR